MGFSGILSSGGSTDGTREIDLSGFVWVRGVGDDLILT